jgi:hypothetical protein
MALNPVTSLANYVKAIGKAYIYAASDPTSTGSWALLGVTEGDIVVDEKFQYNDFKLPEWTGDAIHLREIDGQDITITLPLHWGDSALYAKVAPSGVKGGGRSKPQAIVTYTVGIVPFSEVGSGMTFNGTVWAPAAPVHAIWLHKATFEPGQYQLRHGEGGKVIRSVIVRPLFDSTKPEGQMLYTVGDFNAQGITTYRM